MYNPLAPNRYDDYKIEQRRRRQREAAEQSSRAAQDFFANALLTTDPAPPLAPLNASAEELHRQRVRRSAALGIQTAVAMETADLEVAHKARKLEGADTKSRIANMLRGMKKPAATTTAGADAPAAPATSAAPLVFKQSNMAAGGYVMAPGEAQAQAQRPVARGKPSSTLMLRWRVDSPANAIAQQPAASREEALAQLGERVRAECGSHGTVRGARVHLLSAEEESLVRARVEGGDRPVMQQMEKERLRVFVRFGTVADAFKTAEVLHKTGRWDVVFYPSAKYDAGSVAPLPDEALCD